MNTAVLFFVFVVVALSYGAQAPLSTGLSSTFAATDAVNLKTFLTSRTDKVDHIRDAHHALRSLALLDSKASSSQSAALCTLAKSTLSADSEATRKLDAESLYYAAHVVQQLNCGGFVPEKHFTDAIVSILETENAPFLSYNYATLAALALRENTKAVISDADLLAVIEKVSDLLESDGTVLSFPKDKTGSLYNTGLAYQLFAKLVPLTPEEADRERIEELAGKTETILDLANEGSDNTLSFASEDQSRSTLATTAELAHGFQALSAALKTSLDIQPAQWARIGEYFLSHKYPSTLADAYHLLNGLTAVKNSPKSPICITVERSSILSTAKGAEGNIKIKVTDIFDGRVSSKLYLVKAYPVGKPDTILLASQEVTDAAVNILAAKPEQGFYNLELRAVPENGAKYATVDSSIRRVKVIGSVSVTDFELSVLDSRETHAEHSASSYKAELPNKIDEHVQVVSSQFIHLQFKIRNAGGSTTRPLVAQQAFVRFTHRASGHEAVFVATPNDNKAYSLVIAPEERETKALFRALSGEYAVTILVGDAFIQNPISWTITQSLAITFSSVPIPAVPVPGPKAEIQHKFRAAEKRPPALISTVFTALSLVPLLVLFAGLAKVGANIRKLAGPDFVSAVGFIGFIGAILFLIAVYWLKLNLIQTLGYLSVLAIPTVFFGNRALSSLARKEQ